MLKKVLSIFAFGLMLIAPTRTLIAQTESAPNAVRAASPNELVFLTWPDYIDPTLVSEFEKTTQSRVRFVYFETEPDRDQLMVESGGQGYDVILLSGTQLDAYRRRSWLAPIDASQIPNRQHINARWLNAFPSADEYAIPYAWGTLGIAYRRDLVPTPITQWRHLLQPHQALHNNVVMINDTQDLLGIALKALGYSANSVASTEIKAAGELLIQQKPFVRSYSYVSLSEQSGLVNGELLAAMIYNGDALLLQEYQPAITFVIPTEGSTLWVDYLVVSASSRQPALAMQFINFLQQPANAARLAESIYMASPNTAAEQLLPAAFMNNPFIYPSADVLQKSEFYQALPARTLKLKNSIVVELLR